MQPVVYKTEGPWANLWPSIHKQLKCEVAKPEDGPKGIPIIWGLLRGTVPLIAECIKQHRPWVYVDHGYFHRSNHFKGDYSGHYRMTLNDFQQRRIVDRPADRWERLGIELAPWRKGRNILVCPPSDLILNLYGIPKWTEITVSRLKQQTDRPIIVNQKGDPFRERLKDAHCVVTVSSIAAVEAVVEGVPVFVSEISAAAPVGRTDLDIEHPVRPERDPWVRSLAYGQFTKEEFGEGWKIVSAS